MNRKILIVEDDRNIAKVVETNLKDQKYDVSVAHDGSAGLDLALSGEYQLIILDLNLPDVDGLEICRKVRSDASYTPILMLTCRTSEVDRVLGLEIGIKRRESGDDEIEEDAEEHHGKEKEEGGISKS